MYIMSLKIRKLTPPLLFILLFVTHLGVTSTLLSLKSSDAITVPGACVEECLACQHSHLQEHWSPGSKQCLLHGAWCSYQSCCNLELLEISSYGVSIIELGDMESWFWEKWERMKKLNFGNIFEIPPLIVP